MKRIIICYALLCAGAFQLSAFQRNFREAVITQNDGKKVNVLLDYKNWKNNPETFKYKLSSSDQLIEATVDDVAGFILVGQAEYISAELNIDTSPDLLERMMMYKEPKWEKKKVFIRRILDSEVDLFYYRTNLYKRFIYRKQGSDEFHQLIYKKYSQDKRSVQVNRAYRKQLYEDVNCGVSQAEFKTLEYKYDDLLEYFTKHNECLGATIETVRDNSKRSETIFNLKGGLNIFDNSVTVLTPTTSNPNLGAETSTNGNIGARLGIELEYIPITNNKSWSLYLESTFEFVTVSSTLLEVPYFLVRPGSITLERYTQDYQLNYNRLAFGLGIRRYFHFKNETSLFVSAGMLSNFAINFHRNLDLGPYQENPEIGTLEVPLKEQHSMVVGLGVKVKRFTGEVRYNTKRNLAIGRRNYEVTLGGIVVLFGMQL